MGLHPVRIVITIAVVWAVSIVLAPTSDELLFHFRSEPATDIADAMALSKRPARAVGSRVRTHVILGNRAAEIPVWRAGSLRFGPIIVRQVLGSPLWVEYTKASRPSWGPFVEADVDGRIVAFDGELAEVRSLVTSQGAEVAPDARVLIVDERPGEMSTYLWAWAIGAALAVWTLLGLVRASRPRVDDAGSA